MTCQIRVFNLMPNKYKQQLEDGVIPWEQHMDDYHVIVDKPPLADRLVHLETFVQNLDAYIYYGDDVHGDDLYPACYIGATDTIGMPYPVQFLATEDTRGIINYYSLLLHEIGHWTRHPERLNRKGGNASGTKAYALEELTAELTSVFVMNRLQITESPVLDRAEYLAKWQLVIDMFGEDMFSLTTAELQAYKACDYLFSLQNIHSLRGEP